MLLKNINSKKILLTLKLNQDRLYELSNLPPTFPCRPNQKSFSRRGRLQSLIEMAVKDSNKSVTKVLPLKLGDMARFFYEA